MPIDRDVLLGVLQISNLLQRFVSRFAIGKHPCVRALNLSVIAIDPQHLVLPISYLSKQAPDFSPCSIVSYHPNLIGQIG